MMNRYGIVFVHGIVGNNKIFNFLKPFVPNTFVSRDIVLQGHGGDALGFSRASMEVWKAQIDDCVDDLSESCDTVIAVGHSMGCLLILDQAAKSRVDGLFLLNPPLCVKPKLSIISNALKVATGRIDSEQVVAAKDAYGISLDFNLLHYYGWPARYFELFKEIRRIKKHVLNHVKCPIRVMLSSNDEMVSVSSGSFFNGMVNTKTIYLSNSTHYYYSPFDRDLINREFKEFINQSINLPLP